MKMSPRIGPALALLAGFFLTFTAQARVYINEVLADNNTAFNLDGEFPDYVELINTNSVEFSISGWRLSIDTSRPNDPNFTYIFPPGTTVPPNGFLMVICDGNTNQLYHTRFNIGRQGESLALLGSQLGLMDLVRFGFQVTDHSFGRAPTNSDVQMPDQPLRSWMHQLCRPTPGEYNERVALGNRGNVRINEWEPSRETQKDWFEIYNPEPNPINLGNLVFSDRFTTPATNKATITNSWLAAGGFLRFFCDEHGERGHDELDFNMTRAQEQVIIFGPNRTAIIHWVGWTNATTGVAYGWLPDGNTNGPVYEFPEALGKDTPGESNFLPIDNVLINEVLAHTDPPLEDAIELYNPTTNAVDISGWFLSDNRDNYNKFQIPPGTIIPPLGYKVFYEFRGESGGFNPTGDGIAPSFALSSSQGDDVYLFSVFPGTSQLNGFRRGVDFPASANGVSFGRYLTSTGESDFVPMRLLTFGSDVTRLDPTNRLDDFRAGEGGPNSEPIVGPLVISEIMYHPPDVIDDTNIIQNEWDEYIEIYNISGQTVLLYDPIFPTNRWRLRDEADFDFPTNVSLGPGQSLIVGSIMLTNNILRNSFRSKYGIPPTVQFFVGFRGNLSDGGGAIELERPDFPQQITGFVPYILVDRVRYNDDPPWPLEADGARINPNFPNSLGYTLLRKKPEEYGSDPTNWVASAPSPGRQVISNTVSRLANDVAVSFPTLAGSTYVLESTPELSQPWQTAQQFPMETNSGARQVVTNVVPGGKRFFRVRKQ